MDELILFIFALICVSVWKLIPLTGRTRYLPTIALCIYGILSMNFQGVYAMVFVGLLMVGISSVSLVRIVRG